MEEAPAPVSVSGQCRRSLSSAGDHDHISLAQKVTQTYTRSLKFVSGRWTLTW